MLKNAVIISIVLLGSLLAVSSGQECSQDCEAKNGTCAWTSPGTNFKKVGKCSSGSKEEGQVCSCGSCYLQVEDGEVEAGSCKKSKKCKGGKCVAEDGPPPEGEDWEEKGWCNKKAGCRCWMKAGEDQAGTCGQGKGCTKKGGTCVLKEEVDLDTMDKVGNCGKACLCVVMKESEP